MKTLYIDCSMGAAGDMLTAALLELVDDKNAFVEKLNSIGIEGVSYKAEESVKCGITGTHMTVLVNGVEEGEHMHDHHDHEHSHEHDHHHDHEHSHEHDHHHEHEYSHEHSHHHSSLHDIKHIVEHLNVSEKVRKDVIEVYQLIAEAESHAHGKPVEEIHFHEVGTMDAVADVTAVCMLIDSLNVQKIIASPIHVGSGHVKCAHGILPVPAPATAFILRDCPIYGGGIKSELCTPTGAALLKHFVSKFGDMPVMKVASIGYGMGKKDFATANCVRVMLGETQDKDDVIAMLSCNIDDMTAEEIGYAMDRLFECKARDVFTVPVGMKKNRPGVLLNVVCDVKDKEKMAEAVFRYTTTIGIRENIMNRYVLERKIETIDTEYGQIKRKVVAGHGVSRYKYEYDDLAKVAKAKDISISEARKLMDNAK